MGSQLETFRKLGEMFKAQGLLLLLGLGMVCGAPQIDQLKDFLASLSGTEASSGEVGDYESLPYTTLQKYPEGYEERLYPSMKFACSELTYPMEAEEKKEGGEWGLLDMIKKMTSGKSWKKDPSSKIFMKLFRYISGINSEQEEIEMTIPVLTTLKEVGEGMMYKKMCFYLGRKHQANPPTPTEEGVILETTKDLTVLVKTFGGYVMKDWAWMSECSTFKTELTSSPSPSWGSLDLSQCLTAGYDSPMKFWNRRNEVMFKISNPNELEQ